MSDKFNRQKIIVVGAGPVGALAALYSAGRGDDVEIYELRGGMIMLSSRSFLVEYSRTNFTCLLIESRVVVSDSRPYCYDY